MNFDFLKGKSASVFSEFATKSFSEAVKASLTALTVAITHSTPVGAIIGAGIQGMTDKLLSKSSEVEKKLDKLLREPLISGIKHLHEGLSIPMLTEKERETRDGILFAAHLSLTRAWAVSSGSIEDSMFIIALDNISLAAHDGLREPAKESIEKLRFYLSEQAIKVNVLKTVADSVVEDAEAIRRFLYSGDPYRDKPIGYGEQKLAYRSIKRYADKVYVRAQRAVENYELLQRLHELSTYIYELSHRERAQS